MNCEENLMLEEDIEVQPRLITLTFTLSGENTVPYTFLALFNGKIILNEVWSNELMLQSLCNELDLNSLPALDVVANNPVILLLRAVGGKASQDPLLHVDNKAGATIDLYPLVVGQSEVIVKVPLVFLDSGLLTGLAVDVEAKTPAALPLDNLVPLMITMVSAHCLPTTKDGTEYVSAISSNGLSHDVVSLLFRMSQSTNTTVPINRRVWSTASEIMHGAKTGYDIPDEDIFIPESMEDRLINEKCKSAYWYSIRRILVDPLALRSQLYIPFVVEIAAVPKGGKMESRGRYMGLVDAGVLLEPGQLSVTTRCNLIWYNEDFLPEGKALMSFPPTSAKALSGPVLDEFGHNGYAVLTFDLTEPLMLKTKTSYLFEIIGIIQPEGPPITVDVLCPEATPEDNTVDVRRIRRECGALAVHQELSELACRGPVPMNQSIKRTAANKLLMRVRAMVKQFPPGECSQIEWQDVVTAQHAASRQAVTASFAPQPPPRRKSSRAVSRALMGGQNHIAEKLIEMNLVAAPLHPKPLLTKALRYLEARLDTQGRLFLLEALRVQPTNKFLLWAYAAREFDLGVYFRDKAISAFRIAANYCDRYDGPAISIAWAALHTVHHLDKREYAAFVAMKKSRKYFKLPIAWKDFLKRWENASKIEEVLWFPSHIAVTDPFIIAAAFFLCVRGFAFSEALLRCYEQGCSSRGSYLGVKAKLTPDVFYLRAASLLLRRQFDRSLIMINEGVMKFGPCPILSELRAACLLCAKGWDGECNNALDEADKAGAQQTAAILIAGAVGGKATDPNAALQRAARAHKLAPSAYTALALARIYKELSEMDLAERWAAVSVKLEPLLADGWAFLAILSLYQRNIDKARTLIRTAKQAGPLSQEIDDELRYMVNVLGAKGLPECLIKDLCLCEYY